MPPRLNNHARGKKFLIGTTTLLFFFSCTEPGQQELFTISGPKSVIIKGYLVPKDSTTEPTITSVGLPEEIKVTKEIVPPTLNNKRKAGIPKTFAIKNPKQITPGRDTFPTPKTIAAISKPFVPGVPEVAQAKDAVNKEQNPESFSSFGKLQGLKHLVVVTIIQDKNGNIWFGTGGGAACYDGKTFTHYTKNEGLCDNRIPFMREDKKGNLWFCTNSGVTKFDGKYFTNYTVKEGLIDGVVLGMAEDRDGNLWFSSQGGGVCKFDGKTFTHYTTKEGLSGNTVSALAADKNGVLWIGTEHGLNKFNGNTFTQYNQKDGLGDVMINTLMLTRNGDLWIGTENDGAYKFDGEVFTNYAEKEGLCNNTVNYILEDRRGTLWFCTFGGGMSKFDGRTFTGYSEKEGLSNNMVMTAAEDRSGNLWFGTCSGANLYHGRVFTHFTQKEGLKSNVIKSIVEDKKGVLWFATPNGELFTYNGEVFTYMNGLEEHTSLIQDGLCDKNGDIWFVSFDGIFKYNGMNFVRYSTNQGFSDNSMISIAEDSKGNLWFGSFQEGVDKFDGKTITHYTPKQGLIKGVIKVIREDKQGNIWFSGESGCCKFEVQSATTLQGQSSSGGLGGSESRFTRFTQKEGFTGNIISCLPEDRNGNMWFGTYGGGLFKYDGKTFTHYTEKEGLADNNIASILQDKRGGLWFGSRFGLNKLKTGRPAISDSGKPFFLFKRYGYEDGFFGVGCNSNSIYETKDSCIWIGTSDRLTVYHPEGDMLDTIAPNVQLTSVGLYNEDIHWRQLSKQDTSIILGNGVVVRDFKFDSLSKWYGLPENLNLAYNNNYLTFNFIGITQKQPDKVKYQYKLEGSNENWSALTNRAEVSYGNLDPAVYTFKIRALSGEGYWSREFNYTFTIKPPFWQTWWFRTFLILIGLGLVFGYVRYRTRKLRKQERELARIVVERTMELEHKTVELEQSNRDKDRIMKMLVHDLRNPLSGIRRVSSMLISQEAQPPNKLKEMLGLIYNSSTSLFSMVDDLIEATLKNHKEGIRPEEMDMELLLNQSVESLLFKANEKKQEIILNTEDNVFAFVDPQKMERVLNNLISNAIKFSPNNSSIIVRLLKNNGLVQISVEDHGIGIPDELKDKVFDMFTKAKRRGTAGEEPFGLGLSICKQIVDAHGGKIWCESENGKGTTFYVELQLLEDRKKFTTEAMRP